MSDATAPQRGPQPTLAVRTEPATNASNRRRGRASGAEATVVGAGIVGLWQAFMGNGA